MSKKITKKSPVMNITVLIIVSFLSLGLITVTFAGGSFWNDVKILTAQILSDKVSEPINSSLGSSGLTATGTPELYSSFTSINIKEELRFGDANTKTDEGIAEWLVVRDFTDATITPVSFENTYGEIIYLDISMSGVQLLGHASATPNICVTTSTVPILTQDTGGVMADSGVLCTLMNLGTPFTNGSVNATSSMLWMIDHPGASTYVTDKKTLVEIKPNIFVNVYATSTASDYHITASDNTFDGELYLKFFRVD